MSGLILTPTNAVTDLVRPPAGKYRFVVGDGTNGTAAEVLYRQDSTGALTALIPAAYTDEQAQDAVGNILTDTATIDFTYDDAGNAITAIVKDTSITNAKLNTMAASSLKGNATGGIAAPTDLSVASVKTLLALASGDISGLAFFATLANLSGAVTTSGSGATTLANALTIKPKDIEGRVFVDPTNTQGWAGADAGAWINSAYAYIHTTYTDTNGGIIELAPGSYTYSTPIVLANAGLMSIQLRGAGDGNGATILNYTATSGTALAVGGGSGNDGGVQVHDLTITGTALGNGATALSIGASGICGVAGATLHNVSIRRFTTGISWLTNSSAYAVNLYNVKIQQCTNGLHPFGENNIMVGGLLGGNTTGLLLDQAVEMQLFGVAFDDNTTTGLNMSASLARATLTGCRFENAGLGTDIYVTQSSGTIALLGGAMQSDVTTGTSTGFGQLSGGLFTCRDTWLLGQGSRVFTQVFNCSGSIICRATPAIAQASVGISTIQQPGFTDQGVLLRNHGAVTVSTTETALMSARIPANAAFRASDTTLRIKGYGNSSSTGTLAFKVKAGPNGTTADTAIWTPATSAAQVANHRSSFECLVTLPAIGVSGSVTADGTARFSNLFVEEATIAAPATTAIAMNAAWFLDFTVACSVGTFTIDMATIEVI